MTDVLDGVRGHYRATGLTARLKSVLAGSVLDLGSGVGGPARFLAASYGCRVARVDLGEPFADVALSDRAHETERAGVLPPIWDEISWKANAAS
jgi:sarcosine/dimethylglycine N-methyltransferase